MKAALGLCLSVALGAMQRDILISSYYLIRMSLKSIVSLLLCNCVYFYTISYLFRYIFIFHFVLPVQICKH